MDNQVNIQNVDGKALVSSRDVAKNFEKRHDHVIRDIENYIETLKNRDNPNLGDLFVESDYATEQTNKVRYKKYLMNRDGFTLLAMGFNGEKALDWQLKYIEAFNKMEQALTNIYHVSEAALVNKAMQAVNLEFGERFKKLDEKLELLDENYRPTHANKISINNYIKKMLGDLREDGEVGTVKHRILMLLDAEKWQDIPYQKLIDNIDIIDESIYAVKKARTQQQLSMLDN